MAPVRELRRCALIVCMLLAGASAAWASGNGVPEDRLVSHGAPDVALQRYDAGELGIVLPTYPRIYLYPAWRAIVLGKAAPTGVVGGTPTLGPLDRACCEASFSRYWDERDPNSGPAQWLAARRLVNPTPPRVKPEVWREGGSWHTSYLNCPELAWSTAASRLKDLQLRSDATPVRLQAWVAAQDALFEFCGYAAEARAGSLKKSEQPVPALPAPLPGGEPQVWRQWREYQMAAGRFYAGDFDAAASAFMAIAAQPGHPMQAWGEYLALRAALRRASLNHAEPTAPPVPAGAAPAEEQKRRVADERVRRLQAWEQQERKVLDGLQQRADHILAQPALAFLHDDVRATLRRAASQLTPRLRLAELSVLLDMAQADPYADDTLGDWRRLANDLLDGENSDLVAPMRQRHEWFDWMRTLQGCNGMLVEFKGVSCAAERLHALERWQAGAKAGRSEAGAWLLAALTTAVLPTPALIEAGTRVPVTAPEYVNVQYHLVRLQRLAGQTDAARQRVDALLAKPPASVSALNQLRGERLALAGSLQDAAPWLLRTPLAQWNSDTGVVATGTIARLAPELLDTDGQLMLNARLSAADLLLLADAPSLTQALRVNLATAAWWRADLLGRSDLALRAAGLSARLLPRLAPLARDYAAATTAPERRHLLWLASLRDFLAPVIPAEPVIQGANRKPEEQTASAWCKIAEVPAAGMPPLPQETAAELARLRAVPPATAAFGEHVLQRLSLQPADKDLPWLLYVTVQSTKGGCVGKDNGVLSRRAWNEQHTRFKGDPWTVETPYWYK